ncbi:MAG: hypothetical protein M0R46_17620 [Candidatus Muirbacterium halophilum]|nr:hypothetical protein [Candidatus Muirbacterium halophilum]
MKKITDSLMTTIFKYASEKRDFYNSHDCIVMFLILKNTENILDGSLLINKDTLIISCPNKIDKVNAIYDDIENTKFVPETLRPSEYFFYIKDLNLLLMNGGASHRLAAIYLYVNNDKENNSILLDNKYLNFQTINVEKLSKLYIDKKAREVIFLENKIKRKYSLYTKEVINLIELLQYKYLRRINKFTFFKKIAFKFLYKFSHSSKITRKLYKS